MASSTDNNVAKLRVELEGIQPLIWRRVAVPTSMKLNQLHHVVQAAMGWLDRHLWMLTASSSPERTIRMSGSMTPRRRHLPRSYLAV
jgi:hypothetical protein